MHFFYSKTNSEKSWNLYFLGIFWSSIPVGMLWVKPCRARTAARCTVNAFIIYSLKDEVCVHYILKSVCCEPIQMTCTLLLNNFQKLL